MLKKIKNFLFGTKPTPQQVITPAPTPSVNWEDASKLRAAIEAVASSRIVKTTTITTTTEPPAAVEAEKPVKKKRTYTKRQPKVETPNTWPFPIEKPAEGVTLAELEALKAEPIEPVKPAAMKVKKPRKAAFIPKQD